MVFLEQTLELGLNFGASYGPRFSTAIATQSDGQEQRRAMWSQPLIVANLAGRAVDKVELDYLLGFHASVKGSAYGFRLRDWSDYQSGLTAIGTGNGTAQTWQLVKRYAVGSYTVTRPITKPVAGSLTLYLNGVATATGWSLNTTTGVLTTNLTGAIAVDFEFDVPVRFAEDQIKFTFEAADPFDATRRIFTLDALTCTEIRIEPTIYPAIEPLPPSMPLFNLGYDYGTNGGPQFDTGIASTASEFESRIPYLDTPKGSWNIGDRTLDRAQVDYFLAFYRLCRGMAVPFSFKDWQDETIKTARFAEDRISLQFNAYRPHDQQVIFYLGGLAIVETSVSQGNHTQNFFFQIDGANLGQFYQFNVVPSIEVPGYAEVFLNSMETTTLAIVGSFTSPDSNQCFPNKRYGYNIETDGCVDQTGPSVFIGTKGSIAYQAKTDDPLLLRVTLNMNLTFVW